MKRKKILFTSLFVLIVGILVLTPTASQAGMMDLFDGVHPNCEACGNCELSDTMTVFMNAFKIIMSVVGSLTLAMFIIGGFYWITSAGVADRVTRGKSILIASIVGLLIVIFAWVGVNFILYVLTGASDSNNVQISLGGKLPLALVQGNWWKINNQLIQHRDCPKLCCCHDESQGTDDDKIQYHISTAPDKCDGTCYCKEDQGSSSACQFNPEEYQKCFPN